MWPWVCHFAFGLSLGLEPFFLCFKTQVSHFIWCWHMQNNNKTKPKPKAKQANKQTKPIKDFLSICISSAPWWSVSWSNSHSPALCLSVCVVKSGWDTVRSPRLRRLTKVDCSSCWWVLLKPLVLHTVGHLTAQKKPLWPGGSQMCLGCSF